MRTEIALLHPSQCSSAAAVAEVWSLFSSAFPLLEADLPVTKHPAFNMAQAGRTKPRAENVVGKATMPSMDHFMYTVCVKCQDFSAMC